MEESFRMPRDGSNHAVSRRSLARGVRASSLHAQICFLVFWGTPTAQICY
jgi:hypothetical protein